MKERRRNDSCLHCNSKGIKERWELKDLNLKTQKATRHFSSTLHKVNHSCVALEEISLSVAASRNKLWSIYMLLSAIIHLMRYEYLYVYMYV